MAVGRGYTKNDIDQRMSSIVEQVWGSLDLANRASLWLANTNIVPNDAAPVALGYTGAEATTVRAAVNDLGSSNGLWGVAHTRKTVPTVNNFFFSAQLLTGVNYS